MYAYFGGIERQGFWATSVKYHYYIATQLISRKCYKMHSTQEG